MHRIPAWRRDIEQNVEKLEWIASGPMTRSEETMASLDQILDRMRERKAERLVARAGEIPVVSTAGRDVPVQKVALAEAQVLALAKELAAPHDTDRLDRRESTTFSYRDFEIRVSFETEGARLEIIPALIPPLRGPTVPGHRGDLAFDADDQDSPIELDASALPARPSARPLHGTSSAVDPAAVGLRLPSLPPPTMGAARAEPSIRPPGGLFEELRSWMTTRQSRLVALGALGILAIAVLTGVLWCNRPVQVPDVVMADASGHPVTFTDMRGTQTHLLVVFLLPGCSMSRFAVDTLKEAYPLHAERMAFVGLFFGTQSDAERLGADLKIPFPVYGLKDSKDPFKVQELMTRIGTSDWLVNGIYGGTTIVLNDQNRVVFKLEKEEVRQLPKKLEALRD